MLDAVAIDPAGLVERALAAHVPQLRSEEIGTVTQVDTAVARLAGLPGVQAEEVVRFPGGLTGIAFDLNVEEVGAILLGDGRHLKSGDRVRRSGRVADVPVGDALLGRVVDATGAALDEKGVVKTSERRPVERDAPAIIDRAPVTVPLETGIKVVDALVPIGRGQRELILGDRQTGKSAVALDTIVNQKGKDVVCIYCAVGQRGSAVAKAIAGLERRGALDYSIVVVAGGEDAPGLQYITPFAATTMGEHFMEQGRDVLIVYDDLTRHARAYRELSLLLRRPPGREAFPGDIFYVHARLLERSTRLSDERGGGSLTALPILETEAQNLSAYIPTNLVSITDGQIYLSPTLFQKGLLPAVDVGRSVSRVGGKTQLPAYREVSGPLRLSYAQFEELEIFARFGTRLDKDTSETIKHGRRIREILKQSQFHALSASQQIGVLLAATEGLFDTLSLSNVARAEQALIDAITKDGDLCQSIGAGEPLGERQRTRILRIAAEVLTDFREGERTG